MHQQGIRLQRGTIKANLIMQMLCIRQQPQHQQQLKQHWSFDLQLKQAHESGRFSLFDCT